VAAGEQVVRTVGAAVDAFLARGDLAASRKPTSAASFGLVKGLAGERRLVRRCVVVGAVAASVW